MKKSLFIILIVSAIFTSCKNSDLEFPDFDNSAVYFAYQYPVRTITLGREYVFDNALDNEHKCQIMATVGGFREVRNDIEIGFKVDNDLCDGLTNVTAMPSDYYSLSSDSKMVIAKGSKFIGGVTVQLTDAFFADPLSIKTNYVIPLIMTSVKNADGIIEGVPRPINNPNRHVATDWETRAKNYILYGVKFINNWDAMYLRRGKDEITKDGVGSIAIRRGKTPTDANPNPPYFVEDDQLKKLNTVSLTEVEFPVDYTDITGTSLNMRLKMTFNSNQECAFSPFETSYVVSDSVRVTNIVVSGAGRYVKDGEKKSWGNKDRDVLYLSYVVEYDVEMTGVKYNSTQAVKYTTADTLVMRDRVAKMETFSPVVQ